MPLVQVQQGEPRKKHLLWQVLFSMISVPYGTDDISSIWYPLSADDICLRHMNGTDIISCLRRKYIIRRKPYIILRQQYIMMHKAALGDLFLLAPPVGLEPTASWLTVTRSTDWAKEEYVKKPQIAVVSSFMSASIYLPGQSPAKYFRRKWA